MRLPEKTSIGQNSIDPRHFGTLDDELLLRLGAMFEHGERWAMLPIAVKHVTMALLETPRGGFNTIGVFATRCRIW
eukprot:5090584-Lingulodinium_polyedra.AAC.1